LSTPQKEVLFVYMEKVEGSDELRFQRAGYRTMTMGRRVLIVDDLLTTGGSVKRLKMALPPEATVAGVSVLGKRSDITKEELGVPKLASVVEFDNFPSYPPDDCPICREGVRPLVDPHDLI
jgi:orotate phosphoribosyltransferase